MTAHADVGRSTAHYMMKNILHILKLANSLFVHSLKMSWALFFSTQQYGNVSVFQVKGSAARKKSYTRYQTFNLARYQTLLFLWQ